MLAALVDDAVAALRRSLGPTAWFVFEELLWRADTAAGQLQVRMTTRELAAASGLNKDTVTRALGRLRSVGVVSSTRRDDVRGKSLFVLRVPEYLQPSPAPLEAKPRNVRGRAIRRRATDQLSLLE